MSTEATTVKRFMCVVTDFGPDRIFYVICEECGGKSATEEIYVHDGRLYKDWDKTLLYKNFKEVHQCVGGDEPF